MFKPFFPFTPSSLFTRPHLLCFVPVLMASLCSFSSPLWGSGTPASFSSANQQSGRQPRVRKWVNECLRGETSIKPNLPEEGWQSSSLSHCNQSYWRCSCPDRGRLLTCTTPQHGRQTHSPGWRAGWMIQTNLICFSPSPTYCETRWMDPSRSTPQAEPNALTRGRIKRPMLMKGRRPLCGMSLWLPTWNVLGLKPSHRVYL